MISGKKLRQKFFFCIKVIAILLHWVRNHCDKLQNDYQVIQEQLLSVFLNKFGFFPKVIKQLVAELPRYFVLKPFTNLIIFFEK